MSDTRWLHLSINPEPWAIGTISTGRKNNKVFGRMSPNQQLVAYQSAIKELLDSEAPLPAGEYRLTFYFWRQLIQYAGHRRQVRKKAVDATNLQKALEDALQGKLIDNDRNVRDIRAVIVEQGWETMPGIVIKAEPFDGFDPNELPSSVWDRIDTDAMEPLFEMEDDYIWRPSKEGDFF